MSTFETTGGPPVVLPALDLMGGAAVRLVRGARSTAEPVAPTPLAAARWLLDAGAPGLHVVDLDGAFDGRPRHLDVLRALRRLAPVPIQYGGGLRSRAAVRAALAAGADRVLLGSRAMAHPGFLAWALGTYGPERVLPTVDVRDGRLARAGWTQVGGDPLRWARSCAEAGARWVLVTDADRDGTLAGANLGLARAVAAIPAGAAAGGDPGGGLRVVLAGGLAGPDDVRRAAAIPGVVGIVLGRALYAGRLNLGTALEAARAGWADRTPGGGPPGTPGVDPAADAHRPAGREGAGC